MVWTPGVEKKSIGMESNDDIQQKHSTGPTTQPKTVPMLFLSHLEPELVDAIEALPVISLKRQQFVEYFNALLESVAKQEQIDIAKVNEELIRMYRNLRIAMVAPLFETIPPEQGSSRAGVKTAQIVHALTEELVRRGHTVTLFAPSESHTSATLISEFLALGPRGYGYWGYPFGWIQEQVRRRVDEFDVLHFHTVEHLAHITKFIGKTVNTFYDDLPGGGTVADMEPLAKLFPHAPIVVEPKNYAEAAKHWHNIVGIVPLEDISAEDLTDAYEQIYVKVLRKQLITQKKQDMEYPAKPTRDALKAQQCARLSQNRLRIAIVAPPNMEPLPPKKTGGTERLVYSLTEAIVKQKHDVTMIAPLGSTSSASVIELPYKIPSMSHDGNWVHYLLPILYSQEITKKQAHTFDIIHIHDLDAVVLAQHDFLDQSVATLHMPYAVLSSRSNIFFGAFDRLPLVAISDAQRENAPDGHGGQLPLNFIAVVHNGIQLERLDFFPVPNTHQPYLAWLGRMVPEKGIDMAIEFAVQAGIRLKVAAPLPLGKNDWWEQEIKPTFDKHKDTVEYVGEIGEKEKSEFLGNALAMLFTPKWDEPFGLTLVESMATGTPSIVNRRGAVEEIVVEGLTGFMFEYDVDRDDIRTEQIQKIDPKELVRKATQLDRKAIRKNAEEMWSEEKMAKNYEKVYRQKVAQNCV